MAPVVEFIAVSKRYRRRGALVLDQVSFRLEAATLVQLRGPNGSGKSTLLRVACGFSRPTAGTVHRGYGAMRIAPDRVTPPARMTARTYITHLARLSGEPRATSAAEQLSERLQLSPGLDAPLGTLSRGNLRKVILTQALMRPVDLIAMDEPFVALDRAACVELATIVTERLAQGCTFLIATHTEDLGALGRTLTLRDGRLDEESGTPSGPACDVPTVAIDLDGRHPATRQTGSPAPGGGVRYLMPASQVAPFLEGALAGHVRVLRLNPVEPEVGP